MRETDAKMDAHGAILERKERLAAALEEIRRKMEGLMAENQRLREVVRLAESELRKRRDQVQQLENELHAMDDKRLEARGRVEHAMEKLDQLMARMDKPEA
jgi:predicted nuclease with TOPRIM domain